MADFDAGSIEGRLTLDRSDFTTGLREAQAQGDNFSRRNYTARLDADNSRFNSKVDDSTKKFHLLATAIVGLAPMAVPIAAGATAAAGGFALMAAAGIAAVKGIQAEMKAGTATGVAYAAAVGQIKADMSALESTAATSMLGSFQRVVADVNNEMPQLNSGVRLFGSLLGASVENVLGGVITGFNTLLPLFTDVGLGIEHLTENFRQWSSTSGGLQNWANYAHQVLPEVASDLGALTGAISHLIAAIAPMGVATLGAFGTIARLINAIPIGVLQTLIPIITNLYLAFESYNLLSNVWDKIDGMVTRIRGAGVASTASAAEQVAANAEEAASYESATEAIVASAAERSAATEGAGAAAAGGAARVGLLGGAAAAFGGPVGLAIAGVTTALGLGLAAWDMYKAHAENAKKGLEDVTSALEKSKGAIDTDVLTTITNQLQGSKSLVSAANNVGVSIDTITQAAVGNGPAMAQLVHGQTEAKNSVDALRAANDKLLANGGMLKNSQQIAANRPALEAAIKDYNDWTEVLKKAESESKTFGKAVVAQQQQQQEANRIQLLSQQILAQQPANTVASTETLAGLARQYRLTTANAQTFIGTLGLTKDRIDAGDVSTGQMASALNVMTNAEDTANASGQGLISALQTFAQSAGTAADKANLIGAYLVASQGDALGYAGAVASAYDAQRQLITGFNQQERAAIDLNTGLINVSKAGAPQLITQLQAMQTAAENAAKATYEHEVSTKGSAQAAKDAATIFKTQTYDALLQDAKQLGLTAGQAKKLADQYFAMPADVTTQVMTIGETKVIETLDHIGQLLAKETGQPWVSVLDAQDDATPVIFKVQDALNGLHNKTVTVAVNGPYVSGGRGGHILAQARGGLISGPGTGTSDSIPALVSNGEFVVNAAATKRHIALLQAINARRYADGGIITSGSGPSFEISLGPIDLGTSPSSSTAQKKAHASLATAAKDASDAAQKAQDAIVAHDDLLAAQAVAAIDPTNKLALAQEAVADAQRRLNNETKAGTTEYFQDITKLRQAQQALIDQQQQMISDFEQHQKDLATARATLASDQSSYNDLIKQEDDRTQQLYTDLQNAAQQHATNVNNLMSQRQSDLEKWASISQQTVIDYGQPIFWLISNTQDQVKKFQDWQTQLAQARNRGVSDAVISALGLDQGPQALGQLEQFSVATQDQIDQLNQAVAQKNQLAGQQVQVEATQNFTALGQSLLAEQQSYADSVLAIQKQFQTDMANLAQQAQQGQQKISQDTQQITSLGYTQDGTAAYGTWAPGTALYIQEPDGSYYHISPGQLQSLQKNHPLTPIYQKYNAFDSGGYLPVGWSMAYNGTGKPERVVSPSQEKQGGAINVRVFIGEQELTHIVRTEVDNGFADTLTSFRSGVF